MKSSILAVAALLLTSSGAFAAPEQRVVPFHFEQNRGQTDAATRWLARVPGSALHLLDDGVRLDVQRASERDVLQLRWLGARMDAPIEAESRLASRSHYLVGADATRFTRDVPHAARLVQRGVWPGVDIVYRDGGSGVEYDFVIAPGADPSVVRVGIEGASAVRVDDAGYLVARVGSTDVVQPPPHVFQRDAHGERAIEGRWELAGAREARFAIADFDARAALVIDPVLGWASHLGGSGADTLYGVAVDATGASYVTGVTSSLNLPSTPGAFQPAATGSPLDVFVAKFAPDGASLVYLTYLGGNSNDVVNGIGVDSFGRAVVAGSTASSNFPVLNAIQPVRSTAPDAFVTRLDATGGALVYSTYLGGTGVDAGWGVASDPAGNAIAAGETQSQAGFPVLNAVQPNWAGSIDGFVTKLSPTGSLVYSTYLGGSARDFVRAVASDSAGQAYLTGECYSLNFPTANPLQGTHGGGIDACVTKLNPSGGFVYSSYLGGVSDEIGFSIATDSSAQTYVSGYTASGNFPTFRALQPNRLGGTDAFVTKLNPTGSAFIYSTYLGGLADENSIGGGLVRRGGITADRAGSAYVTGVTSSLNSFPAVNAIQPASAGGIDSFVTKLDPPGQNLVWSTYLGGGVIDQARAIAIDPGASVYVVGETDSVNFPTTPGSVQPAKAAASDGFLAKIAIAPGTFTCQTAMSQSLYANGQTVTATTLRFMNDSTTPEPVRFQLALTSPGGSFTIFDIGTGGFFSMPGGFDVNLGPVPMFVVDATFPRGSYSLDCTMVDPATGAVHSTSSAPFTLQ